VAAENYWDRCFSGGSRQLAEPRIGDPLVKQQVRRETVLGGGPTGFVRAKAMGEHLAKAGTEIAAALDRLEGFAELKPHRLEIHRLENEGDRITREAIGDLFAKVSDAAELVKWKDIYDLLEATMDACEQAANVMETISIKNA